MSGGKVIWLTDMFGAGKTTIADAANLILDKKGYSVHQLDGDDFRNSYGQKLDYNRADILHNNKIVVQLGASARQRPGTERLD